MKIVAKKDRKLLLINTGNTQNENKAETIELTVPEEYEDYNKKIVFVTDNGIVWDIIQDNTYKLTKAITKYKQVDFYIWLTKEVDGESIDFRTKTKTLNFYHNEDASNEITDEEIHGVNTVVNLLEEEIEKVENLNIEATKIENTTTVTITKKDGTTESVEINDGTDGQDGYTPQKGVDYFTEQDIEEIETDVKNDLEENVLVNYSLIAETGAKIELSINPTDYKLKAILKDKNNNIIHTSNVIDLPLETMVVNATYDNVNKAIILTLQNLTTVSISVADLVAGLQTEITSQNKLASDLVDDTNSNNKFVTTSEKRTWNDKLDESDLIDYVKNTDYASSSKGGVLKTNTFYSTATQSDGNIRADVVTYNGYQSKSEYSFIGKGTLENVIAGKQLINQTQLEESQETQDEEIEKLQTENARLKATLPTTTGEGQAITLDKTAELEFKKPPLPMGNSEQVQYSGKNILATNDYGNYTINNDGSYTNAQSRLSSTYIPLDTTKTDLVFSCNHVAFFFGIAFYDENKNYLSRVATNNSKYITGVIPSSTKFARTFFAIADGSIVLDESSFSTYELQLEYGTTPTSYEPYTNGASPNPDYPQEITNVTGDVEVVVENKNLFDKNNVAILNAYISNNTITANSSNRIFYLKVKPNTTYAITKYKSYYFTVGCVNKIPEIGDTITNIQYGPDNYRYDGSKGFLIYTTDATAQYIVCRFYQISLDIGVSLNDMLGSIQVEVNSTPTDYIEHKEQTFTFPLGNEKLMLGDYLADDGIHHVRGQATESGTVITLNDAKSNGAYLCNKKTSGNLVGKTLTFDEAITDVLIEYELEEEVIVPYTSAQQEVYNQIKQALSYEEQTNISSNIIALFNVEAYQSTKLVLEEMATAIVALGGV